MNGVRRVGHLTTVDSSLRYLLEAQLVGAMDAGYEVVGISAPGDDVTYLEALGVRHVALAGSTRSFSLMSDLRAVVAFARLIRSLDLDVLHTHNPKPGLYGRIIGRLLGVPRVVNTVHGLYATPEDAMFKRAVVYGAEAVASRFSHRELIQNEEDFALLAKKRISPRRKLVLLGNGVDTERFSPGRDAASTKLRESIGADDSTVVIGIIARLVEEKGFRELFEAAGDLPDGVVVVAIGPEDAERHDALSRDEIDRARSSGIRFVGHQADTAPWYRAMDVFALPSYREGVPRGAMEAAATALPIVTTDVRGCRQVVRDGDNGLLVPARDPGALAAALNKLCDDADLRRTMGAAGRRRALAEFDERDVVRRVLESYGA